MLAEIVQKQAHRQRGLALGGIDGIQGAGLTGPAFEQWSQFPALQMGPGHKIGQQGNALAILRQLQTECQMVAAK